MNYVNDNFNPLVANQIQKSTAQSKTEFIYPMCVKLSEGGGYVLNTTTQIVSYSLEYCLFTINRNMNYEQS